MKKTNQLAIPVTAFLLALGMASAAAQVAVPASFAHPSSQAKTSAPGFKVRVVQANKDGGTLQNSIARAESQLAGTLINPVTKKPYVNQADPTLFTDGGFFDETGVISYDVGGTGANAMPGIPGPNSG